MNDLEQAIAYHERKVKALKSAMPCDGCPIDECSEEHRQLAEWLRELQDFKALFVKANRDVGNVHLDNRAIFEKFFWDCWRIFKADVEVQKNDA